MKQIIYILGFYLLISIGGYCQKYNFKNFTVADGLTQSEIYAICEDRRGNLWFGSRGGGIIQYDGYDFTSYREEDGLKSNFINTVCEDDKGTLWIGTYEGLCTYNGISFVTLSDSLIPLNDNINAIIKDSKDQLWIGTTNQGLIKYTKQKFSKVNITDSDNEFEILCLYEDTDKNLWIGTDIGVCKYKKDTATWYTRRDGLSGNNIRSICGDGNGNIWFATYGNGVSVYNGKYFLNYNVYNGLCNNTVYAAFYDGQGNVWFGTAHGVSRYDGMSFKAYRENSGLASNVVVCINNDASQNIWFGTSGGGISKFDSERFIHYTRNEKLGRGVLSVIQALNGNMVFGTTMGGISVFDGKDYTLIKGINGFTNSRIISLWYAPDSTLWCGTLNDGAYRFKDRGFERLSIYDGLHSNNIAAFTSDTAGNIWFASLDSGICIYNSHLDTYQRFNSKNGLKSNVVYTLKGDNKGNVWVGTANGGIHKYNFTSIDTLKQKLINLNINDTLTNKSIKSIAIDSNNNIYFGTSGDGIIVYDGQNFKYIKKKSGICSNNIYLLQFDNDQNLWAGTEQGIDKITFDSSLNIDNCFHYGRNEGFTGIEVYRNSSFKDKDGNMWFGTVNGATLYNPEEDKEIHIVPKLHITNIKLFYDDIKNTKYTDTTRPWYPIPPSLKLPHRQNSLTFEFAGIYQRNPDAVRYKWILEGFEEEWSPELKQREITYSNLPPGSYTFKVNACSEYGVWNTEPSTFAFEILTPLWQRWWFISLIVLSIVLIIGRIIYMRFKRIKTKNRIEQEKLEMEKTIIELEQEAARLQMNPHFIFNSLNSIQGYIASKDTFQAKRYLAKFARLMRLILENSREEFVPIENEVEILDNYLELEKLRTNNKFDYKIEVDELINKEATEIPPMMIQPFVENAIIHGMKNKTGSGFINIKFNLKDKLINCEIIDDGVGREQASKDKVQTPRKHKSTGISVTRKRLEQLKLQSGLEAGIEILDLKDKNDHPAGTKVNIFIPYESF